MREVIDESIDHAAGAQPGSEYAGSNNDADDARITAPHAVKEFLSHFRRAGTSNGDSIDSADQHGGSHRHLELRRPNACANEDHDRKKRSNGKENVGFFRQISLLIICAAKLRKTFAAEIAVDNADDNHQNNRGQRCADSDRHPAADEVHDRDVGELSDEGVVRHTRAQISERNRPHHARGSDGRMETRTNHEGNDRRTDCSYQSRGRRDGNRNQ